MNESKTDLNVSLNDEGYLTDFSQWTKEIGLKIAQEEQVEMTDRHWQVIEFLQEGHRVDVPARHQVRQGTHH